MADPQVSVVTPTYLRSAEVEGLLDCLALQTFLPAELVLIDGSPAENVETAALIDARRGDLPFAVVFEKWQKGTAVQRNHGLDLASGDFVAFLDDDVQPDPHFLEVMLAEFSRPGNERVGGIVGYRKTSHSSMADAERWRWYRRLRLFAITEPGRYDRTSGYPINANLQPPFAGVREVDFMTTACAVWKAEVFADGLRFDEFFADYGVLEDAHLSLRAGRTWTLLQCGDATCVELSAPSGRVNARRIGFKSVVNYHYVFNSIEGPLTAGQRWRFWRFQAFELFRMFASLVRRRRRADLDEILGRLTGMAHIVKGDTQRAVNV